MKNELRSARKYLNPIRLVKKWNALREVEEATSITNFNVKFDEEVERQGR